MSVKKPTVQLVARLDQALDNIRKFSSELGASSMLAERLGYVRSWYALRLDAGGWLFAPSKFVGYRDNTAKKYEAFARPSGDFDGRETERALEQWFGPVKAGSRLGRELSNELQYYLEQYGKRPNANSRINVIKSELENTAQTAPIVAKSDYLARISADPAIASGRPCIKGTRMRVSDLLGMLAAGATREEILEDFPYISSEDISAGLAYAAAASDHRIINAA